MLASSLRLIGTLIALGSLPCAQASAASTVVTNTNDAGAGSLRSALATAGNGDSITVPAGTYVLTTGALAIPAGVTLLGSGARATTLIRVDASGRRRLARRRRLALRVTLRLRAADGKLHTTATARLTLKAHR